MDDQSKTFQILTTERFTLRQLSKSDSAEILQLRSNPQINKFLNRKPSETLEDALNFINKIIETQGEDLLYWAITKSGEEKLIGTICLFEFLSEPKKCKIGYELLTEYQGQGIMTESAKKVTEYASKTLGLKMIDAITHKENQNSTGLLLKLGFKALGNISEDPNLILFRLTK